jgi:hypothetical protein
MVAQELRDSESVITGRVAGTSKRADGTLIVKLLITGLGIYCVRCPKDMIKEPLVTLPFMEPAMFRGYYDDEKGFDATEIL